MIVITDEDIENARKKYKYFKYFLIHYKAGDSRTGEYILEEDTTDAGAYVYENLQELYESDGGGSKRYPALEITEDTTIEEYVQWWHKARKRWSDKKARTRDMEYYVYPIDQVPEELQGRLHDILVGKARMIAYSHLSEEEIRALNKAAIENGYVLESI